MKKTLAAMGISILAAGLGTAEAAPAKVKVDVVTYRGWANSLRISNGIAEAVVVPQIGRIMAFQWAGKPETSPIFVNPTWAGKTLADATPTTWAAFGGDKLWPSPQSEWGKHHVRQWPPDQAFDGSPEIAQILPDGVRLITPPSSSFAAHATRTITMKPGEPRLYVAQTLDKDPDAAEERSGYDIGIWSITQVRGDATVYVPLAPSAELPAGYRIMSATTTEPPAQWTAAEGVLSMRRDPTKAHKIGSNSDAGWLALLYGKQYLFSEHYTLKPGTPYSGGEHPVEVYTNPGTTPETDYMEMELLGPMLPLMKGESTSCDVVWQLTRLPKAPRDDAEARAMVAGAMKAR